MGLELDANTANTFENVLERKLIAKITPCLTVFRVADYPNMGKKRKVGGKSSEDASHKIGRISEAKLRINTYEDVADSEDEFHINRDKILLEEGPAQKKQRRYQEEGLPIVWALYELKTD